MPTPAISDIAKDIRARSARKWGTAREIQIIAQSAPMLDAQQRLARFAKTDRPVLLTGESGTGKELFARALYLLSNRANEPFRSINCAQYQEGDLLTSELFGHRKGSFTGARTDHQGLFEAADGGTVFLDEVGELSPKAQAMLLRALGEGEIKPLGAERAKHVDVRVVAATNRPLKKMVREGRFREDLFYRLRYLHVDLPPVCERGKDWRLLVHFFLRKLNRENRTNKEFTPAAWSLLEVHEWPGNIREIKSIVEVGFCLSESQIEPSAFEHALDVEHGLGHEQPAKDRRPAESPPAQGRAEEAVLLDPIPKEARHHDSRHDAGRMRPRLHEGQSTAAGCFEAMLEEGRSFWETVRKPYLDRELNRAQVRAVVKQGLRESEGSYKRLLPIFRVEQEDYLKFMDFLRHHRLKPRKEAVNRLLSASEQEAFASEKY